jgi:hypothetical protein
MALMPIRHLSAASYSEIRHPCSLTPEFNQAIILDSKIRKEKWEKETNLFQMRNEFGVDLSVTINGISKLNKDLN